MPEGHCHQNDKKTMNDYKARKLNDRGNVIFGLLLLKTFISVKTEVEMFPKWSA